MNDPRAQSSLPQPANNDPGALIVAYLDDRLDAQGAERLSDMLVADAQVRDLFVATCMQARIISSRLGPELEAHAAPRMADHFESMTILREVLELEEQANRRREEALAEQRAQQQAQAFERRQNLSFLTQPSQELTPVRHYVIPRWTIYSTAAAIAAMLLLLVLPALKPTDPPSPRPEPQPEPVARAPVTPLPPTLAKISGSFDVQWANDSATPTSAGNLIAADYHLLNGCVRLEMANGGKVIVQAPSRFRLDSGQKLSLTSGRLVGRCSTTGHELVVQTPSATIVDIGTEFGVAVDNQGVSEVHVFDGIVEITPHTNIHVAPQRITRGQARQIDETGEHITAIEHHELAFVRNEEFQANIEASRGSAYHRWLKHQYELRRDPSLVVYYAMHPAYMYGDMLMNLGSAGPSANAAVIKTQWLPGRFENTQTMAFIDPDAMLLANVPGKSNQLTIAAWVKINQISYPHSGIVMSEGWLGDIPGFVHFGVESHGFIDMSVTGPQRSAYKIRSDTELVNAQHLGRWLHLAVVYDNDNGQYRVYRDGEKVLEHNLEPHFPTQFGLVQIGNWTAQALGWGGPNRVLNGNMDELCIFYRALSDNEVLQLYRAGVPPS